MSFFGSSNPVFEMLEKDHAKVKALFQQFEKAKDARSRARIVEETLRELEVHTKLEETLIYPAIGEQIDKEDLIDEAWEEHHVAHVLINELKRMRPGDARYAAKFKVLGENIKHHVREEESSLFPEAEKADLDWEGLEQKARERKETLMAGRTNGPSRNVAQRRRGKTARRRQQGHIRRAA